MRHFFLLIITLFVPCLTVSAQVVLMPGDYADPSVLKDGEDYYVTHSPFHYQPGFLIWHSRDLLHWEPVCRVGSTWSGSAWAPDLQKVGDTYYIYFPASETNWVITAKNIRGPWSAPIDLKIGGIDPGLVVTPEGKRYLFTNGGQVTPLTPDGLARGGWYRPVKDMPLPEAGTLPSLSDDFAGSQLGWQWTGWKENIRSWATVGKDGLSLPGKGSSPKDGRLMLITATDEQYTVEVEVCVPKKNGEAGLLLFYDEKAFAGVSSDGKNFKVYQDAEHSIEKPNTIGRCFRIRLENKCDHLDILVSRDGNVWQTLAEKINIADFHHNRYRGFIALRPAIYSVGIAPSQFKHFSYQSSDKHYN